MQITIIGSGDAFGSGGRANTCFHLRTAKSVLLIDCGASALPRLKHYDIDLNAIDGIILSHLHGDH
ncbi:MAG: MBL fold metallo-hydrolase, partial [Pseudolabrys sp.]